MKTLTPKSLKKETRDINNLGYLRIKFKPIEQELSMEGLEQLGTKYSGEIYLDPRLRGDSEVQILVGKVKFIHVNLTRYINGRIHHSLDDLTFEIDNDVHLIYQTVFEYNTTDLSNKAEKEIGTDVDNSNFVVISNMEILPQYRNYGIGKLVIKFATDFFSGNAGYIFLKSFPKQDELFENSDPWRTKMNYEDMQKKFNGNKYAQKSLDNFYSKYMDKLKLYKGEGSIFYINMAYNISDKFEE